MALSQITEFKQFLFDNFSSVGMISFFTTVCLVVLSLALREVFAWFAKTDKLRKEIVSLMGEIKFLQGDIKSLAEQIQSSATTDVNVSAKDSPTNGKASAFPLNH